MLLILRRSTPYPSRGHMVGPEPISLACGSSLRTLVAPLSLSSLVAGSFWTHPGEVGVQDFYALTTFLSCIVHGPIIISLDFSSLDAAFFLPASLLFSLIRVLPIGSFCLRTLISPVIRRDGRTNQAIDAPRVAAFFCFTLFKLPSSFLPFFNLQDRPLLLYPIPSPHRDEPLAFLSPSSVCFPAVVPFFLLDRYRLCSMTLFNSPFPRRRMLPSLCLFHTPALQTCVWVFRHLRLVFHSFFLRHRSLGTAEAVPASSHLSASPFFFPLAGVTGSPPRQRENVFYNSPLKEERTTIVPLSPPTTGDYSFLVPSALFCSLVSISTPPKSLLGIILLYLFLGGFWLAFPSVPLAVVYTRAAECTSPRHGAFPLLSFFSPPRFFPPSNEPCRFRPRSSTP